MMAGMARVFLAAPKRALDLVADADWTEVADGLGISVTQFPPLPCAP